MKRQKFMSLTGLAFILTLVGLPVVIHLVNDTDHRPRYTQDIFKPAVSARMQ